MSNSSTASPLPHAAEDEFLIASLAGGDAAALDKLMDRYDRLVRFAIFRASKEQCRRDPQWLDSIASATWAGFVTSLRRAPENRPRAVKAFLVQIARNQIVSALRKASTEKAMVSISDRENVQIESQHENHVDVLARLELIEALRACLADLDSDDRPLAAQLGAIIERRWKEAASVLGIPESTLRSRWKVLLERLGDCVEHKTNSSPDFSDEKLAPQRSGRD